MKILHTVESYLPSRHGMQEVVTQISEYLVNQGHEVIIATSFHPERKEDTINGVKIYQFKISGNSVKGIIGDKHSYISFLKSNEFDIITNFAAQQWATDLMLPILNDISGKKVFVPTGFSALNNSNYNEYFKKMKDWMKAYDENVFLSNDYRDIEFARMAGVNNIKLIPNGASKKEFSNVNCFDIRKLLNISENTFLILSVGGHTGYKGHDEAIKIYKKANIKNSAFLILGNLPVNKGILINILKGLINLFGIKRTNSLISCKLKAFLLNIFSRNRKVFVREFSRENTINAYNQANIFLFPSLIECSPIVLFEAMAASTPFLVTDVGNSKEIIRWTEGGILLPTIINKNGLSIAHVTKSAQVLKELASNNLLMKELGQKGNQAFQSNFTWEIISRKYEELYLSLID